MLIGLFALASSGCGNQPKERTLTLATHAVVGCGAGPPEASTLNLSPLGDFSAPVRSTDGLGLRDAAALDFPQDTRAIAARAIGAEASYLGYVERASRSSLDLLLWPEQTVCRLDGAAPAAPSAGEGQAVGYDAATGLVLVVGGNSPSLPAGSVAASTFDAGLGEFAAVASGASQEPGSALAEPRAFATVTPFGEQLLVAAGEDPLNADGSGLAPPSKTAETFDPRTRRFASTRIDLTVARSRHSALALASGDTLLVGGRGPSGSALNALEVVSAGSTHGSIQGLAALLFPRLFPSALLLDDGRVFVGGGTTALGTPLSALEWLSADAKQRLAADIPEELPPRHDRAFAALPGGGVLAVGGCEPSGDICLGACRSGCPPRAGVAADAPVEYDAWWIAPDGALTRLPFGIEAPRPVLLGGADGRPLLASGAPGDTTLYRFDPWLGRFEVQPPTANAPPRAGLAATALDNGAFIWLAEDGDSMSLFGARLSVRNHFSVDENLVDGAPSDEATDPYPLVPDRPVVDRVRFDPSAKTLFFDADSSATVFVAASDYANVTVELTVEGDAPRVVLGTFEFGGAECPWPAGAGTQFQVERMKGLVTLRSGTVSSPPCPGPSGRARLGLRRGDGALGVRHLRVTRTPE